MAETVLILGGIKEAAALAARLAAEHPDWRVITSLAGRTKEPRPVAGEVRIGGFGGVDGLVAYLKAQGVTLLIDGTHPFATQISANAQKAAAAAGIKLDVHTRPPWQKQQGDRWIEVQSLAQARDALPAGARVLLAIGAQHMAVFASRSDVTYVARTVDAPSANAPLKTAHWLVGIPSTDWRDEAAILRDNAITHIICRNSGGTGAYAKIEAARHLGLPLIMVQRP